LVYPFLVEKKKEENGGEGQPSIIHSLRRAANELRDKKKRKELLRVGVRKIHLIKEHTRKAKKITNQF